MTNPPTTETERFDTPTACPFCASPKVAAAAEKVDASTYWRCEACGEMWNLSRLRASSRGYDGRRPERSFRIY